MKRGDLVKCSSWDFTFEEKIGIVLTWVRYGGPDGTVWEILFDDCTTEYWDEDDLAVVNEA